MPHTEGTRQERHTTRSATKPRSLRTFRGGEYVANLMAELDRAAISQRLAVSREEAGLTQPEMAELLGLHYRAIQNYESPKHTRVPFDRLDEWAKITGKTKEWLLHGDVTAGLESDRTAQVEAELAEVRRALVDLGEVRETVARIEALLRDAREEPRDRAASA